MIVCGAVPQQGGLTEQVAALKLAAMKILIPLDGSALALEAVRMLIRLTREGLRAEAVLANVQAPSTLYEVVVAHDAEVLEQVSSAAGVHALQQGAEQLRAAGIEFESEVTSGDAVHGLVDIIERFGCDAVVIASSGAGALSAALVGSVPRALLHASPVPVMIVRAAEVGEAVTVEPDLAEL